MQCVTCVICKRPLLRPFKTIQTKGEPIHWGRGCAIKTGVHVPRHRISAGAHSGASEADPRQLALDMEESRDA